MEISDGKDWEPNGNGFNAVPVDAVYARKVRVVFTHAGKTRSRVSELFVWKG